MTVARPKTPSEWRQSLDSLPSNPDRIPAFFFGHGSPMLAISDTSILGTRGGMLEYTGPKGPLANFLRDFGPALLKKYNPKAIVVFSAHWETEGERLVSDYGEENPLYFDYYGFPPALYTLKFKSRGDSAVTQRVVDLFKDAGLPARASPVSDLRGVDGLHRRSSGLDHGVFVPFRLMFGEEFTDIPVISVSLDSSLDSEDNWKIGQAIKKLREEKVLILSGGLTIHNLRDFACFTPDTAKPGYIQFDQAILDAVSEPDPGRRKTAMKDLAKHTYFRTAQPREDHFVPLYIAAGAGEDGDVKILSAVYGSPAIAFGL